ncbi:virulence-associated protein E [Methylohalobius crimeensis]|uniref:virulence-associated protein E n=1 Tax=Methylohalobius crimeensis TaxID=244365 RepID=UPI0003B64F80|nr:virulence-associated protein E [Methylohalobius crimeensis]
MSITTSPAETILPRLEKVKRTGQGRWTAKCPAHDDKSPSLSIREGDDGRILLKCFAECSIHEITQALGLELRDLFPPRPPEPGKPAKRIKPAFYASDVLRALHYESLVLMAAGETLLQGAEFSDHDLDRIEVAVSRIENAMKISGVRQNDK